MKDANTIIEESVSQREEVYSHLRAAADFFHEHEGTFFERGEAIEQLSNRLGIDKSMANEVIGELVSDIVDPVVLSVVGDDKYVGVVDYEEFDGAYGYINYHDVRGPDKRVVCQQCVNEATFDTQVAHATAGDPSGTISSGADYDELLEVVYEHYENSHDVMPEDVATGATLASGTTIGGNTAYHTGNLADRGAVTITPSTTNQTIPEGFHNGNGFVEGDADLIADNIRSGVDIFGVTGNISAIPDIVVDSFEDGDISEYSGNTGAFEVVSDNFSDGNNALKGVSNGSNNAIRSTSGLVSYFPSGYTARCDFKITGGNDAVSVYFGVVDETTSDQYRLRYVGANGDLDLGLGTSSQTSTSVGSINTNTRYQFEIDYRSDGSTIVGRLLTGNGSELGNVSITDSTYNGDGIGFDANTSGSSGTMYWDDYRVLPE